MEIRKKKIIEHLWSAFLISSIAYVIIFVIYLFLPIFFPIISTGQNDAWLLSNYVTFYNYRNRAVVDFDIVICDLNGVTSRDSIAQTIEKIESFSPKVIGCDIIFSQSSGIDTASTNRLKRVIESYDNIILATRVVHDVLGDITFIEKSIFDGDEGNVDVSTDGIYDRECKVDDITYLNFASAVAEFAKEDIKYPKGNFAINYSNKYFFNKNINEITESDIKGKIVILGDLKDLRDYVDMDFLMSDHRYNDIDKPIYRVPGSYLHAYTISSIINDDWVKIASDKFSIIFGFIYVFISSLLVEVLKEKESNSYRIIVKFVRTIMIISFFFVLYFIYKHYKVIMDPLYLTIGIALIGTSSTIKVFAEVVIKRLSLQRFLLKFNRKFKE